MPEPILKVCVTDMDGTVLDGPYLVERRESDGELVVASEGIDPDDQDTILYALANDLPLFAKRVEAREAEHGG